jgi:hypothetical protein
MDPTKIQPREAIELLIYEFGQRSTQVLRQLLEERHLYQSLTVQTVSEATTTILAKVYTNQTAGVHETYLQYANKPWAVLPPQELRTPIARPELMPPFVRVELPTIKVFCATCDRREPFNPARSLPVLFPEPVFTVPRGGPPEQDEGIKLNGDTVQVLALAFQCQSCKGAPEVFLIRRQGMKLILSGRTPIEHLDVPGVIPKTERHFFEGAVLAHQSGQTLAGLFLQRTLIEQHARRVVTNKAFTGGELLQAYTALLPPDFNSHFPSLSSLYDTLSIALHNANGDKALFSQITKDLVKHFDARRVHDLTDENISNTKRP